tara:strand:+ start:684 stop:1013 length:330 start_codon:yes stop_codon:yes gene_type:complete
MEKAFDSAATRKILVNGLLKPNPANESIPMWTVEHFDQEPEGVRYARETWEKHPACRKAGIMWSRVHKNPLDEFRGLTQDEIREKIIPQPFEEKVEVIDPKDLPTTTNQ